MSAPAWTKGPWEAEMFPTTQGYPIRGGTMPLRKGDRVLAVAMDQGSAPAGESKANARLIAAAPDLYEALAALQLQALQSPDLLKTEWGMEALDKTSAALAKAGAA